MTAADRKILPHAAAGASRSTRTATGKSTCARWLRWPCRCSSTAASRRCSISPTPGSSAACPRMPRRRSARRTGSSSWPSCSSAAPALRCRPWRRRPMAPATTVRPARAVWARHVGHAAGGARIRGLRLLRAHAIIGWLHLEAARCADLPVSSGFRACSAAFSQWESGALTGILQRHRPHAGHARWS